MLPERPTALNANFAPEFSRSAGADDETRALHHQQICPKCSHALSGHHCKLVCAQCGYYMSCADYY